MKKFSLLTQTVSVGLIRQDASFIRIWKNTNTHAYFTNGVDDTGYYVRPRCYYLNGYYYLLGNKSSLDAIIELGHEAVEIDIIDTDGINIVQFLLIFLSKEHKNLGCSIEFSRLALEYMSTEEGTAWFANNFDTRDKEKRLSQLMDVTESEVKCYIKLLRPGNENELERVVNGELSLTAGYQLCGSKKQQHTGTGGTKNEPARTTGNTSPALTRLTTGTPETQKVYEDPDESDVTPTGGQITTIITKYGTNHDSADAERLPLEKVVLHFVDGGTLELAGNVNLTADGVFINSTKQLSKNENGCYHIPSNYKSIYLVLNAAA